MTHRILLTLILAGLTLAAADVNAGDRRHGGWYHHHPPRAHHYPPPARGAYGRHHRGHHYGYERRSHHRHHRRDALKWVAGAALLGSLVASIDRPRPAYRAVGQPAPVVRRPYSGTQRWYQRDAYGDCFEVRLRRDGQQVWTLVDPSQCY